MNSFTKHFILFAFLLAGCVSTPPITTPISTVKEQQLRAALHHWQINGVLGGKARDHAFSLRFQFLTCGENYEAIFSGPLGVGALQITKYDKLFYIQQGKKRYSAREDELADTLTNLPIPLTELKNWLKGATNSSSASKQTPELIQVLQQNDWTLDYREYTPVLNHENETIRLPRTITFTNELEDIKGKMVIYTWTLETTSLCQKLNNT